MSQKARGIRENLSLFSLLVLTNGFVGGMVGLERAILPLLAETEFGLSSISAALSFIISFGITKAIINLFAGNLADRFGRKKILISGWCVGLWVPFFLIWAPSWGWVVFANILLGIQQGLTWSMTVNMKIDIVKPNQVGLAIGLNEFAGYSGVALLAALSGYIATRFTLHPGPFYLGIAIGISGLIFSCLTRETSSSKNRIQHPFHPLAILIQTGWKNRHLVKLSCAGLVTNLKDGMAWGLFPLFFVSMNMTISQTGFLVALYPACWGFFQLFTGPLSDRIGRKGLIVAGLWIQAVSIWLTLLGHTPIYFIFTMAGLGLGTAMVYPTLQAAVSDISSIEHRASLLGGYRFWRDFGYAAGALSASILADSLTLSHSMMIMAFFPFITGVWMMKGT